MIYKPLINVCTYVIYVFNLTGIVGKQIQNYFKIMFFNLTDIFHKKIQKY